MDYDFRVDYYAILEVDENATLDEIKKSYRRISLKIHPDKNKGAEQSVLDANLERLKIVNDAKTTLFDDALRVQYDRDRRAFEDHREERTERRKQREAREKEKRETQEKEQREQEQRNQREKEEQYIYTEEERKIREEQWKKEEEERRKRRLIQEEEERKQKELREQREKEKRSREKQWEAWQKSNDKSDYGAFKKRWEQNRAKTEAEYDEEKRQEEKILRKRKHELYFNYVRRDREYWGRVSKFFHYVHDDAQRQVERTISEEFDAYRENFKRILDQNYLNEEMVVQIERYLESTCPVFDEDRVAQMYAEQQAFQQTCHVADVLEQNKQKDRHSSSSSSSSSSRLHDGGADKDSKIYEEGKKADVDDHHVGQTDSAKENKDENADVQKKK